MKAKKKLVRSVATKPDDVDAFMAALSHPLKSEIEAVRKIIRGVSPTISEAIKWKSPSFRTTEFFATVNLRSTDRVQIILHLGAKVRNDVLSMTIADPSGLLKWLAKDRCVATVGAGREIAPNKSALEKIVRQWISYV